MNNYRSNVEDYLSEDLLINYEVSIGDEIGYIPFEEMEANFCYLESIKPESDSWKMTLRIENEFTNEKYTKEYIVNVGSKIELNTFGDLFMCFLPPEKIPVLVEIKSINENSVLFETVGILEEYAADQDKKAAEWQAKFGSNQ